MSCTAPTSLEMINMVDSSIQVELFPPLHENNPPSFFDTEPSGPLDAASSADLKGAGMKYAAYTRLLLKRLDQNYRRMEPEYVLGFDRHFTISRVGTKHFGANIELPRVIVTEIQRAYNLRFEFKQPLRCFETVEVWTLTPKAVSRASTTEYALVGIARTADGEHINYLIARFGCDLMSREDLASSVMGSHKKIANPRISLRSLSVAIDPFTRMMIAIFVMVLFLPIASHIWMSTIMSVCSLPPSGNSFPFGAP